MKLIRGSDILALGEAMAGLKRMANLFDPEKMNEAIRAGCTAADVHLTCSYPECFCKQIPTAVKAAIEKWEQREPQTE